MTSTQEPKTMASQSALSICSRKWKAKYILGLKRPSFVPESFFFVTGVRIKFRFARLKINVDRAPSTTVNLLLRALRAIYNISSDDGDDLFVDELLVYRRVHALSCITGNQDKILKKQSGKEYVFLHISVLS